MLVNPPQTVAVRRPELPSWQTTWTDLADTKGYKEQLTAALRLMSLETCAPLCACSCHQRRHKQSPQRLKSIAGTVSVTYSKNRLMGFKSKPCNVDTCRNSRSQPSVATVHLPPWVAKKAARLVLSHIHASVEPTRALTVQNVRHTNDEIFCAARRYHPNDLIRMIREGKGRPSDVDEDGESLLHVRIDQRRLAAQADERPECNSIFSQYFDDSISAFHWSRSSSCRSGKYVMGTPLSRSNTWLICYRTPYDRAYEYILKSGGAVGTTGHRYRKIFPDIEPLSSWGLTTLHKIVLGMDLRPLSEALLDPQILKDINTQDTKGRTALWWAIDQKHPFVSHSAPSRRDAEAYNDWMLPRIQALLDAGADPNIADSFGDPPLRQAMLDTWLNIPMMRLLASYGADLIWCNKNKMSSLHVAARYHDSQELMDLLGSAPGWQNYINALGGIQMKSPLQIAIREKKKFPARWLLDHGADIEMTDPEQGDTAILYAIDWENYDVVKHILETRRPNLMVTDMKRGKFSLLGHVSAHGNSRLYNLLASHRVARDMDFTIRGQKKDAWNIFDTLAAGGWEESYLWDPPHIPPGGFGRDAFWRLLNTKTCERCAMEAAKGIAAPVGLCPVGWKGSDRGWKGIEPLRVDSFEERTEYVRWQGRMQLEESQSESVVVMAGDDETEDLPPHGLHAEDDKSIQHLWIDLAPAGRPPITDEKLVEEDIDESDDEAPAISDNDTTPLLNEKNDDF